MFSLICTRINGWANNAEAADLIRYGAHYYVTVMCLIRSLHLYMVRWKYCPLCTQGMNASLLYSFYISDLHMSSLLRSDMNSKHTNTLAEMSSTWASYQLRKIAGCACAGMPGKFPPPPQVSDPDMHHGMCVTHVPWCMPGSLTSGFRCNRWSGKRSRHSRCMRNSRFYVSGKRPIVISTVPADGIAVLARTSASTLIAQVGHRTHTHTPWWHHQMETVSALLVLCAGNYPVTRNSPH